MPTAPFGIAAANHPVKTADRRGDALKAAGVPPKTIRLRGHWPVRVEPAIDKKQAVIAVMGRTSQARVKGAMARIRSDLLFDIYIVPNAPNLKDTGSVLGKMNIFQNRIFRIGC